ncbi:MAG: hypothetical protein D6788_06465 [Planctomycetota bacterium]|nr:MAG: hypothetical protein D6788_06465 [Planctomycetota bacterium]
MTMQESRGNDLRGPENADLWSVSYEQSPLTGSWVYKFDHEPVADGGWHGLNRSRPTAWYKIVSDRLRVIIPESRVSPETLTDVLTGFDEAGLLQTEDELEIRVRRIRGGYAMTSRWVPGSEWILFPSLTTQIWNDAYRRLKNLENDADDDGPSLRKRC